MALTACGGAASSTVASSAAESTSSSAAAETAAGTLSGNVATGGSTSMKNVIAALTEGFAEIEPDVTIAMTPPVPAQASPALPIRLWTSACPPAPLKDDEKNDVDGTIVALDGIAIVVNKASKVADLTVDQLKQMFTGEITNWADVGGDDGEIVLIGREAGSGTRDGFESIVDVKDSCKYAQELTATGAVISAVEANPLAVGYASPVRCGRHRRHGHVEGVECSEDTVKDGSYKIQRPLRVRHQQERGPVGAGTGLCGLCHQQGRCRPHPHRRRCAGERVTVSGARPLRPLRVQLPQRESPQNRKLCVDCPSPEERLPPFRGRCRARGMWHGVSRDGEGEAVHKIPCRVGCRFCEPTRLFFIKDFSYEQKKSYLSGAAAPAPAEWLEAW